MPALPTVYIIPYNPAYVGLFKTVNIVSSLVGIVPQQIKIVNYVGVQAPNHEYPTVMQSGPVDTIIAGLPTIYPLYYPALQYTFVGASVLPPWISSSRGSSATFYGSNGLLQVAATNVPRFDYNPFAGVYDTFQRANGVLNGSVSKGGQRWETTGASNTIASVTNNQFVNSDTSSNANVYAAMSPSSGVVFNITAQFSFLYQGGGTDNTSLQSPTLIADASAITLATMLHLQMSASTWTLSKRISGGSFIVIGGGPWTAPLDGTLIPVGMAINPGQVIISPPGGGAAVVINDADIGTAIVPQYVDLQIIGPSTVDYNLAWNSITVNNAPTFVPNGLLDEATSTNTLLQSNALTTSWTTLNVTLAQNVTGPDGVVNSAWTLTATGTNNASIRQILAAIGASGTLSAYVQAQGTAQYVYLGMLTSDATSAAYTFFDLSARAVGTQNVQTAVPPPFTLSGATITPLNNGWYRIATNFSSFTPGAGRVEIGGGYYQTNAKLSIAGQTTILYGIDLEPIASPTSYIPTTAAAVTRAADSISLAGIAAAIAAGGIVIAETESESTGVIARTYYAPGTFSFAAGYWYRSMGVYNMPSLPASVEAQKLVVGAPY